MNAAASSGAPVRRVSPRHFVRLKLRVMGNNFRGQGWRIALFVVGVLVGLWFAGTAFLLLAAPGLADNTEFAGLTAAFAGGLIVLGWLFLPLVFFGVDETLDPARFALLPLRRRTLVSGMFLAALIGVPAIATFLGTGGIVVSAALLGGAGAAAAQAVGIVAGLLLCVAVSRAVTSAFATLLRSRRVRDLAAVLLAVLAALLGPLQIAVMSAVNNADWQRLSGVARVIGWTPLAAPYTVGMDVVEGRAWAVPLKLAITAVTIAALLAWWSRSLESAMVGTAATGRVRPEAGLPGQPVARLFPRGTRWLSRDRYGALVARELRYWWRDTRRRASLITFAVVGIFVPVMANVGGKGLMDGQNDFDASPTLVGLSMLFVGMLAALSLANQFGFDGSAYAANVIAGVPGKVELRARLVAYSIYIVPLLVAISIVLGLFLREPAWIGVAAGTLFAAYGAGLAITLFVSVFGAYALPETSNPFAMNSGAGMARSLLSLLAMVGAGAAAMPMVIATALLGEVWFWLALPVGLAYGVGAAALGTYLAGDVLDRRMPELLQTVTPRR
ncbi:ABC transporter permease [Micromonospora pattaloongensis]|uniref:ABC transporter permease n=1 Tax=Micromonospora pattaloongensis TaxID=405436 RepID=UPI000B82F883